MSHATLAVIRHGESEWNRIGRFQGWTDVALSAEGEVESRKVGELLSRHGHTFDWCCSSVLRRSADTARIVLDTMALGHLPIQESWRLNERHYGALQGHGTAASFLRYGLRVMRCQTEFDCTPPPLSAEDPRHPGHDPRYAEVAREELPGSESLRDTYLRMLPFWNEMVIPELERGGNVLMVSHKNVLRGLLKLLDGRTDGEIRAIKVARCVPIVFEFDRELKVVHRRLLHDKPSKVHGTVAGQG